MSGGFEGERAVVIGAGVAGASAARVLLEEGAEVRVTDARVPSELDVAGLSSAGAEVRTGGHERSDLEGATLVVASPGVPPHAEVLGWAAEMGLPVWGEMELGARLARVPYLAVTGTNGKTTVTGMIEACLRAAGMDAVACGNIGRPFPASAREDHDVLVVEVSSFQLARQESFHPRSSVLLNVAPDHIDWHGSFESYVAAKALVYANQSSGDTHVGNAADPAAAGLSAAAPCPVVWFSRSEPPEGGVGYEDGELVARIGSAENLGPVAGERAGYREDAAAAAAVALSFGVSPEAVTGGLKSFRPAHHRGEVVAEVAGVRFIDNSKATNVHAALAAIDACPGAVLIAGGRAKGQDLAGLGSRAGQVTGVVAIGESAAEVVRAFGNGTSVRTASSIEEAVRTAFEMAPDKGAVLLAPACASWDMFTDYAERGDRFAAAALQLEQEVTPGARA